MDNTELWRLAAAIHGKSLVSPWMQQGAAFVRLNALRDVVAQINPTTKQARHPDLSLKTMINVPGGWSSSFNGQPTQQLNDPSPAALEKLKESIDESLTVQGFVLVDQPQ